MKRKSKAISAVRAADKPPRRKAFSKVDFKRAISAARSVNLPVSRVDIGRDGNVSLVIGTGKTDDTNTKNPWDEVLANAAHEKRPA